MALNRDCDFDKSEWVIVAEVRPLDEIEANSQGNIRGLKTRNTFYLPANGSMPESFVDFRRIDRLAKELILIFDATERRLSSLNDEAREALQWQIALFFGMDPDIET